MFRVLLLMLFFVSVEAFAEYDNMATRIYIESKDGYSLEKLRFGINETATNSLDTVLGEWELPPFPPPEGIHAGFLILDTNQNENVMSYLDLRPYPENNYDTVKYVLQVFKGTGDIITFKWNPLGLEIRSAVILDKITEGELININMKDSSQAKIDNEFIERFLFMIVYEPTTAVVDENSSDDKINVYPVEFTDRITISCDIKYSRFEIYNLFGSQAAKGDIISGFAEVNFNSAAPGVYFVVVLDGNNNKVVKKVVKY